MGEMGIDGGGPTRELFRLVRNESKKWFCGPDHAMLPVCSASAVQVRFS